MVLWASGPRPCCQGQASLLRFRGARQGLMCGNFLLDPVPLRSLLFSPSALVGLFYPSEKGPSIFFRLFLSCPASPAPGSDPQRRKGCPSPWSGKAGPLPRAVVVTTVLAPRAVGAGGPGPVEAPTLYNGSATPGMLTAQWGCVPRRQMCGEHRWNRAACSERGPQGGHVSPSSTCRVQDSVV